MTREKKIKKIKIIVSCGFLFAICYHFFVKIYFNLNYPFDTFLFRPEDRFNDFLNLYNLIANPNINNPLSGYTSAYFQMLFSVPTFFSIFSLTPKNSVFFYLLISSAIFCVICGISLKENYLKNTIANIIFCCLISYPFVFTFDRANLEIIVFFIIFLLIKSFQDKNYKIAGFFLALAVATKPFPIVFAALFLVEKRFKELFFAVLIFVFLTITACYLRHETIFLNTPEGLNAYQNIYAIGNEGLFFGNSLWGMIKAISYTIFPSISIAKTWVNIAPFYFYFTALTFLILTIWLWFRRPALWKQVALLVCAMNLLPFVSGDYKLIHLFLPLFLFVNQNNQDSLDRLFVFIFGLLLIPKSYGHIPGLNEASLSVVINPILMALLFLLIILSEYKKPPKPEGDFITNPIQHF